MSTHLHQDSCCPECGYRMDRSTNVVGDEGGPAEGDWVVCINCAAALRYKADLDVRTTTLAERNDAPSELIEVIRATALLGGGLGSGGRAHDGAK